MKLTEQLEKNQKELKKRIAFLLDEFYLENGNCEIKIDTEYFYNIRPDNKKVLIGRALNININL